MPLTSKGKKILAAMTRPKDEGGYGPEEGKRVFYASINKGTITGAEEEIKQAYLRGFEKAASMISSAKGGNYHREGPRTAIDSLLEAKRMSDGRQYGNKHTILQKLMTEHPEDFQIDSDGGHAVGVTHIPTGFRIHMPRGKSPL